jgi:hypothetical protein
VEGLVVSCISKKPTITCVGVKDSFKQLITKANVSTLPLKIQRSKLVAIVVTYANKQHMQVHSFFSHCKNIFFPLRQNKKETQYEGIGVILTFVTKYFHNWKVACATFAYMKVETLDPQ